MTTLYRSPQAIVRTSVSLFDLWDLPIGDVSGIFSTFLFRALDVLCNLH